jgi:REP element-mobilizing transposase RayT
MRSPYTELYVHLVWATWDRLPLIAGELRGEVYAALHAQASGLGAGPKAIGGIADHVHMLIHLPTTISVSELVGRLKGATSHMVTHRRSYSGFFKWQGSYGVFTVSKSGVPKVAAYIHNQEEHHNSGRLSAALERTETDAPPLHHFG